MRTEFDTTLSDAEGGKHQYEIIQHPATEGLRLFQRILDSIAHPAGALLAAFQAHGALPDDAKGVMEVFLDDGVAGDSIGAALQSFVSKIGADLDLFQDILKYAYRDGEALASRSTFDSVYQGNYFELFAAVGWSLKVNFSSMIGAANFPFPRPASARRPSPD